MKILLISECDKKALTETRRICDQFGQRTGRRTWLIDITQQGLETLQTMLKKTARKNTAVACHYIHGINQSNLLWLIGNRTQFNDSGIVPTNIKNSVLPYKEQNALFHSQDWMLMLTALASLMHDLGKATCAFQDMLTGKNVEKTQYRHEWISLRLFESFVCGRTDSEWLSDLATANYKSSNWIPSSNLLSLAAQPFNVFKKTKADIAAIVGWLILSHHRLPLCPLDKDETYQSHHLIAAFESITASWNDARPVDSAKKYAMFKSALPVDTLEWRVKAAKYANKILARLSSNSNTNALVNVSNPYLMHVGRMCLMLGDHHYSSLTRVDDPKRVVINKPTALHANTKEDGLVRIPNQTLDEHLVGVAKETTKIVAGLSRLCSSLPSLSNVKELRKKGKNVKFSWQDKARDAALALHLVSKENGAFVISLASTGCGKTLGNAKIIDGLFNGENMRCSIAMGLRTLTLQTGRALREKLNMHAKDLAIMVGGNAKKLFDYHAEKAEMSGSASQMDLTESDLMVDHQTMESSFVFREQLTSPAAQAMITAPWLVCTIDHLTPATESSRGGRQIAPMLRLMSSDVILDEPDDFDLTDMPALTRLVNFTGLLGGRLILSSATLPPALLYGLYQAYTAGRMCHNQNRGSALIHVPCLWVDEHRVESHEHTNTSNFQEKHSAFIDKRLAFLATQTLPRKFDVLHLNIPATKKRGHIFPYVAQEIINRALSLHNDHSESCLATKEKRISFGVVRMANIKSLIDVALALHKSIVPENYRIHLCVYHSQHPLIVRSGIEHLLDELLQRHDPLKVFSHPSIQKAFTQKEANHLFIVLGSPVVEVGRDHDYDWAIIEPSSMRSMIQTVGRVRRHRPGAIEKTNISLLRYNVKSLLGEPVSFSRPGFENSTHTLTTHDLNMLLPLGMAATQNLDASSRIQQSSELAPKIQLSDLEHVRLQEMMLPASMPQKIATTKGRSREDKKHELNATSWWLNDASNSQLHAILLKKFPFRKQDTSDEYDLLLWPEDDDFQLYQAVDAAGKSSIHVDGFVKVDKSKLIRLPASLLNHTQIESWVTPPYRAALEEYSRFSGKHEKYAAKVFGTITLLDWDGNGWSYHPDLGFF